MGGNMVNRLLEGCHKPVVSDRSAEAIAASVGAGALGSQDLKDLVSKLSAPRAVWVMVPAGKPTQSTVDELAGLLSKGDTIIDGGNTNFHDDQARGAKLSE